MKWYRYILPFILAQITRHPRTLVDVGTNFNWSSKSWIHNTFRVYELIFGRRYGIKCEMSSSVDGQQPHTFEAVCALAETMLRMWLARKLPEFRIVRVPALATPQGVLFQFAYRYAVAFDAAAGNKDNSGAVTNITWSHTVTGSNTFMVGNAGIQAINQTTTTFDAFTYNALALTLSETSAAAANVKVGLYYRIAPTTGANTVSLTISQVLDGGGEQLTGITSTYSGAAQTGQPDSSNIAAQTGTQTSFTVSTTVVATDCWISGSASEDAGDIAGGSPGTGTTYRDVAQFNQVAADSNGTVSTGSQSLIWGRAGNLGNQAGAIMSIAPGADAGAAVRPIPFLNLLGIGT